MDGLSYLLELIDHDAKMITRIKVDVLNVIDVEGTTLPETNCGFVSIKNEIFRQICEGVKPRDYHLMTTFEKSSTRIRPVN